MPQTTSDTGVPRTGTQSIERTILLLRELATRGTAGWGLWDLADRCALDRGTTHRMLACLVRERMVHQRSVDRRYVLGPLVFELGTSMVGYGNYKELAAATVRRLARSFSQVVALAYLRSGDECVCIARFGSSSYTRQGSGIQVGNRAPMLSLAGGCAILSALDPAETQAVLMRNRSRLAHLSETHLGKMQSLALQRNPAGYVLSTGVVWQRVNSIAIPFFGADGSALGSLTLSGAADDYPANKMRGIAAELMSAADGMTAEAASLLG